MFNPCIIKEGTGHFETLPGQPVSAEPANLLRELHGRLVSINGWF